MHVQIKQRKITFFFKFCQIMPVNTSISFSNKFLIKNFFAISAQKEKKLNQLKLVDNPVLRDV